RGLGGGGPVRGVRRGAADGSAAGAGGAGMAPLDTVGEAAGVVDCAGKSTREINLALRDLIAAGQRAVTVHNPAGRHNLAVGLADEVAIAFDGPVGYFVGGMMDGPRLHVAGN